MKSEMIDSKRLKELERAEFKLRCLEAGGVDNWEFYGEALKDYSLQNEVEELVEDFVQSICEVVAESDVTVEDSRNGLYIVNPDENELETLLHKLLKSYEQIKEETN